MDFIEKNESCEKFYSVDYDKEKLNEILEKLKNYNYMAIGKGAMGGVTQWPATEKIIKKRVISFFNTCMHGQNAILHPETIIRHEDDYVSYEYSYDKRPDLYDYINLIVNVKNPFRYKRLFRNASDPYICFHWDQLALEGLLNYANSPELTNHNSSESSKEKYDYKGLNELYIETLKCFNFNLIAVKEYLKEPKSVNVLSLRK